MRFVPDLDSIKWEHHSEIRVRDALVEVNDHWVCLHHVKYRIPPRLRHSMGGRDWGEADFILMHPDFGLIGIEAKGGEYLWDANGFRIAHSGEEIRDPIDQAMGTRSFVHKDIRPRLGNPYIPYSVVAAFPDMVCSPDFGHHNYRGNIVDRSDLQSGDHLRRRLTRFVQEEELEWRGSREQRLTVLTQIEETLARRTRVLSLASQIQATVGVQAQATRVAFDLHADQLAHLTEQSHHRRTWTSGHAGTGKSLLALETARALASNGFRVLFYTPNSLQGLDTVETLRDAGALYPGNRVPMGEGDAGVHVEYLPERSRSSSDTVAASNRLADDLLNRFASQAFDALVVDEYQDVTLGLEAALRLLVVADGGGSEIHVFGDNRQRSIETSECAVATDFVPLALTQVCRNSTQIHDIVKRVWDLNSRPPQLDGRLPEFIAAEDPATAAASAAKVIRRLATVEHLRSDAVQVLVSQRPAQSWFNETMTELRRNLRGTSPTPRMPVAIDNFKGLEAPVVVVVTGAQELDDTTRRELYVGVSRAQAHLIVVGPQRLGELLFGDSIV